MWSIKPGHRSGFIVTGPSGHSWHFSRLWLATSFIEKQLGKEPK